MTWLNKQVSLYSSHRDNTGRPALYRQILLSEFGNDFPVIFGLRQLQRKYEDQQINDVDFKIKKAELKSKLRCFSPSALLQSRAKGNIIEISRSGIMQLDFDHYDIQDYDIEELKQAVFSLPFIAFCSLSCSGKGFYALALIAEPEKLNEYAEHCFNVFLKYGIKADRSKGRNVNDLRYLSYDANMLIREHPEILRIKHLNRQEAPKPFYAANYTKKSFAANSSLINKELKSLQVVNVGNRWQTVQKVAYTLGGLNDSSILNSIKQAIESNGSFAGEEKKYLQCAEICFKAGSQKPIQ
ncbi:MAG: BT4734/BF3469 family protein [Ginsengibacter sp.]